ncbi:MAG: hypothetical protein M3Z02_04640 [Actinomycetota bacterium]|nr:hypothetical protein [Actinomycetota bacterium]
MSSEDYVRPALVGREPAPRWVSRWRFRLAAAVVVLALAAAGLVAFRHLSGATSQDPGVNHGLRPLSLIR